MKTFMRIGFSALLLVMMVAVCWSAPRTTLHPDSGDELVVRPNRHSASSLDEDFTQLRYVKTTDYGATWSPVSQAGDLSGINPTTAGLPDFSACVMANNELCYAVTLPGAPTPGVYALAGPSFTPVLAMAAGTNHFNVGNGAATGWTDIGRTPNGDLFILIWGHDATNLTTFWSVKSTDNGATWGTPFVIATTPGLPAGAEFPHISDMNSAANCFVLFQAPSASGYSQYLLRFPTAGGSGTIVPLNSYSGTEFSYYTGNCKPIAYDPAADALYLCFRNSTTSAVNACYSANQGQSFSSYSIPYVNRYPSVCLRAADHIPFVFSNVGVVVNPHVAWESHDALGYGGNGWTAPHTVASVPNNFDCCLLYMIQGYWWDGTHGVVSHNLWSAYPSVTPKGIWSSRTTDGGATWVDFGQRWDAFDAGFDWMTCQNGEIAGGSAGVAFIAFSGGEGLGPVHVSLPDTTANPGSQICIPVTLGDATERAVLDFEFTVNFDPSLLNVVSPFYDVTGGLLAGWTISENHDNLAGTVHIVAYSESDPLTGSGTALCLKFAVNSNAPGGAYTPLVFSNVLLGAGSVAVTLTDGSLTIPLPHSAGYVELVHSGPPNWGYRLHCTEGQLDHLCFTDLCPGTTGALSGTAAQRWTITFGGGDEDTLGLGVCFTATVPLTAGAVDTFWLSHPTCSDVIHWCANDSCGEADGPLPVELVSFQAVAGNHRVTLNWVTASESDNHHFEIARDGIEIAQVPTQGNDAAGHSYTWIDNSAINGTMYSYSLTSVDQSGNREFLRAAHATPSPNAATITEYALQQNYPNPFNPTTSIRFDLLDEGFTTLKVYNLMGQEVASLVTAMLPAGPHVVSFDASTLSSGVYLYRLNVNGFVAEKKMLLIR